MAPAQARECQEHGDAVAAEIAALALLGSRLGKEVARHLKIDTDQARTRSTNADMWSITKSGGASAKVSGWNPQLTPQA